MEMAKSDVTSNPRKRKRRLPQKLNRKLQKQQRKFDESNKEPPVDNSMQKDEQRELDESNKEPPVDNSMQKDEQRELDDSNKEPPVDNSMQKDVESAQNNAEPGGQQIKTKKKKRKKKKKKKKVCNTSNDSNILNYPEDDGSLVAENPPLETDSSLQPPLNIYLKTDAKMVDHNVEVTLDEKTNKLKENTDIQSNACMSLAKEKNKDEECNKRHNALDNNNTDHDVEEQTWTSDVPILEPSVTNCLMKGVESAQNNTKRTRKRRKKNKGHIALENSNNLEEKSLLVENPPLERDSEMVEFDAEMTLYEQRTKRKEKSESYNTQSNAGTSCPKENNTNKECNERHNASVNSDIDHDGQEGGVVPSPESVCGKHIDKTDSSSVSSHVEMDLTRIKENYEPPIVNNRPSTCSDTCSIMKGDSCTGVHQKMKQEQIKTYRRKRKLSDSLGPSLEPVQEDETSSLMQVPQSSLTKESSIDCFNEASMMQITEGISVEEASVNCVDCQPASEESKRIVKVNNSKRTSNEDSFAEDMPMLSIPASQSEQPNMGKQEKIHIVVEDGVYAEKNLNESTTCSNEKSFDDPSGCDPSCKLLKQNNLEEAEPSSSVLNAMEDNADLIIKNKDNPPEKAITGHSRKKLLILDLNGLLADIVPYVSDGTKPDTIISGKAVFKRPFCDDFLQFCFERFDVGVWSSRTKKNVDKAIDFLMGKSVRKLLFCWDQSHCTYTGFKTIENSEKPLVLKELKKIWEKGEYNESNTLLLDDSPYKALRNPAHTAIFPRTYRYKDIRDCSLGPGGDLRVYLEGLAASENVQEYVKQNPFGQRAITESNCSWGFYRKIVSADSSRRR